jgi:very-short-patch-repair endonuclease
VIAVDSKAPKTATKRAGKSEANLVLETHLAELGLLWNPEYKFSKTRDWRADYAIVGTWVLLEIEGGIFSNGRHTRGSGYERDLEKYNTVSALGYKLFRFSTAQVLTGKAKEFLKTWLCSPAGSKP